MPGLSRLVYCGKSFTDFRGKGFFRDINGLEGGGAGIFISYGPESGIHVAFAPEGWMTNRPLYSQGGDSSLKILYQRIMKNE